MKRFVFIALVIGALIASGVSAQDQIFKIFMPPGGSVQVVCEGEDVGFFVQQNTITNGVVSCLAVLPTPTPVVVLPTATPTSPVVPTGTPTSVVTPLPSVTLPVTINVPFLEAPTALNPFDANNRAIAWAGNMSPDGGHGQIRLVGESQGLNFYAQIFTPTLSGEFVFGVGDFSETIKYNSNSNYFYSNRCTGDACRGWGVSGLIPWDKIGQEGGVSPFEFIVDGEKTFGTVNFGLPAYNGSDDASVEILTIPVSRDATVGGGTDCGADNDPNNGASNWFATWGSENNGFYGDNIVNMGTLPWAIAQNQWDTADWPCFAKYIFGFEKSAIPAGSDVVSATLHMYHFGDPGYGAGYDPDGTGDTVFQIFQTTSDWNELDVTWDNLPPALENISWTLVKPLEYCDNPANCWESFDVTELVKRGADSGIMYTGAGQYHSGKQFYSKDGSAKPYISVAIKRDATPTPVVPTATNTPVPTATATKTVTPQPTATKTATPQPTFTKTPIPATSTPVAVGQGIWISQAEIDALPTSGPGWVELLAAANANAGSPSLSNQDSDNSTFIMAKALVCAKLNTQPYCGDVESALNTVANGLPVDRALALGRELVGYVLSADIINLKQRNPVLDAKFRTEISALRTKATKSGPDSLIVCDNERANNWGGHCGASRIAVDLYLGDTADLQKAVDVLKSWMGDYDAWTGLKYNEAYWEEWQSNPSRPVGVLPVGAKINSIDVSGLQPEEMRRAGGFTWPPKPTDYAWEGLQGRLASAKMLQRAGYPAFEWSDRAMLRAVQFLYNIDWPAEGDDQWQPYIINKYYGTNFPTTGGGKGKNVGWSRWTDQATTQSVTPTVAPSATAVFSTPTATPTNTATSTPLPATVTPVPTQTGSTGITYYVATNGADTNNGKSATAPFKNFSKAMQIVVPGDTVLIASGVYNQKLQPVNSGTEAKPITIKAINDGGVVIDGGGSTIPVEITKNWYILEGLVVRNGFENVLKITGQHNFVKRSTFYNADTNWNSQVVLVWGDYNTLEDVAAAGTGRYMFDVYSSNGNTVRRAFAMWRSWDGKRFCGVEWPNGNNIGIYNSSNTILENSIAYARSLTGIFYQSNADDAVASGNKILGSISVLQGKNYDGSVWTYGTGKYQPTSRPGPTDNPYGAPCDNNVINWEWGYSRTGFSAWGQGTVKDNLLSDSIFVDNEGIGVSYGQPYSAGEKANNNTERVTSRDNWGAGYPYWEGKDGGNIYLGMSGVNAPVDSKIANSSYNSGQGARIPVMRYQNGQITNQELKPWPMEARILAEMGVSVNAVIDAATENSQGVNASYPIPTGGTMLPAP